MLATAPENCVLPEHLPERTLAEAGKFNAVEFLRYNGARDLEIACGYAKGKHFKALSDHISAATDKKYGGLIYYVIQDGLNYINTLDSASLILAFIPDVEVRKILAEQVAFYLVRQPAFQNDPTVTVPDLTDKILQNTQKINATVEKLANYAQDHNYKKKGIKEFMESLQKVENIEQAIFLIDAEIANLEGIAKSTGRFGDFFYRLGHFGKRSTTHGMLMELQEDLKTVSQASDPEPSTLRRFMCCT